MNANKNKVKLSQKVMARYAYKVLNYPQPENTSIYAYTIKALEKNGIKKENNISDKSFVLKNWLSIGGKFKEKSKQVKEKTYKNKQYKKAQKEFVQTNDFLQSYGWRKLRMEAILKYGRKCQCCGSSPETGSIINVDHIKPRSLFPNLALDIDNLQILCHECNHGKSNWDQTDWR